MPFKAFRSKVILESSLTINCFIMKVFKKVFKILNKFEVK